MSRYLIFSLVMGSLFFGFVLRSAFESVSIGWLPATLAAAESDSEPERPNGFRSPVDLVLASDGQWLVTANETTGSISLVDTAAGRVLDELFCGERPASIALRPKTQQVVVSCSYGGQVLIVQVKSGKLIRQASLQIGIEPTGIAVSPDGQTAYVGLVGSGEVAQLDLDDLAVTRRIPVGKWPRYLAVSPDGGKLAVIRRRAGPGYLEGL